MADEACGDDQADGSEQLPLLGRRLLEVRERVKRLGDGREPPAPLRNLAYGVDRQVEVAKVRGELDGSRCKAVARCRGALLGNGTAEHAAKQVVTKRSDREW